MLRGAGNSSGASATPGAVAEFVAMANGTMPASEDPGASSEEGYTEGGDSSNSSGVGGAGNSTLQALSGSSSSLAATLYEDADFAGAYNDIYGAVDFLGWDWGDKASSLVVYPYWCVTLYEHPSYVGYWHRWCAGSSPYRITYVGDRLNDQASSVWVAANR